MKILWICGLPNEVRQKGAGHVLSSVQTAAWSWILGHLPPPAGVELHILCPVLGLTEQRVDFEWSGVHWHCFRQRRHEVAFLWLRFYFSILRFVKQLAPDVIHGWGGETGCGWLATLLSRRAVVSVQGLLLLCEALEPGGKHHRSVTDQVFFFLEKNTYRRARLRMVESLLSRDELQKRYGLDSVVVPHPLRHQFVEHEEAGMHNARELLFVGRLVAAKGVLDLIRAFVNVRLNGLQLTIIGSGPEKLNIQEIALRGGCDKRVSFISECSARTVYECMQKSGVFVLPSYADTGPTVLKEAISQGLYPICYNNSGPRELVNRYWGSLVDTGDVQGLTAEIERVCLNFQIISSVRAENVSRIRQDLSPTRVWNSLLREYSAVCL